MDISVGDRLVVREGERKITEREGVVVGASHRFLIAEFTIPSSLHEGQKYRECFRVFEIKNNIDRKFRVIKKRQRKAVKA